MTCSFLGRKSRLTVWFFMGLVYCFYWATNKIDTFMSTRRFSIAPVWLGHVHKFIWLTHRCTVRVSVADLAHIILTSAPVVATRRSVGVSVVIVAGELCPCAACVAMVMV